jgi:phage/conjugal plasmid C-4 type zinc finger TraR family protein
MATGWAQEGAVQEQIDATVKDAVARAKRNLPTGPGLSHCGTCGMEIPQARRLALPGVRLCVTCQATADEEQQPVSGYNRRGSKDSQLR